MNLGREQTHIYYKYMYIVYSIANHVGDGKHLHFNALSNPIHLKGLLGFIRQNCLLGLSSSLHTIKPYSHGGSQIASG
jgi:hypothetical protein